MKSKVVVLFLVLLAFVLGSCSSTTTSAIDDFEDSKFDVIEVDENRRFLTFILLDEETGVEYLAVYLKNGNISVTPRYNSDGSLYVKQGGY